MNTPEKQEELRAENDFLKMKMMLEKGAKFHSQASGELTPELENEFLNNIMEFERQLAEQKVIKVYEKIGRPAHFKPVASIPEEEIDEAWKSLSTYLYDHGISLDACNPGITVRELYRFATEELFEHEIGDMNIPGMIHGFIYDEFHPDPVYDNTRLVVDHCIQRIFEKRPMDCLFGFRQNEIRLNEHYPIAEERFMSLVNNFKNAYEDFDEAEISNTRCSIKEKTCVVNGIYAVSVRVPGESIVLAGNWFVELAQDEEFEYWYMHNVCIEGIKF